MIKHRFGFALSIALGFMVAGCGPGGPPTAKVEGVVTLDGKPLGDIRVNFQPDNKDPDASGMGSFGLTDSAGKFELKLADSEKLGAVVGGHTVVLADKKTEDVKDSDAGSVSVPKSRIPVKYIKQPLTFQVKSGEVNSAKLELTTK